VTDPLLQIRDRLAGEVAYYETLLAMALGQPGEVRAAEEHSAAVARLRAFDGLRRGQEAHLG
jgi:hypothetical protein